MVDNLNVCIIGYGVHPPWNEGCANVTQKLALALSEKVNVFAVSSIDYFRGFLPEKSEPMARLTDYVETCSAFRALRSHGKYVFLDKIIDSAKVYSALNKLNSQFGIDIVHLCNISHLYVSMLADIFPRKPLVAHIFASPGVGDLFSKSFVDAYACTTQSNYNKLVSGGVQRNSAYVIPPIIDCSVYRPTEESEFKNKLNSDKNFVLSYIGNINNKRLPSELLMELEMLSRIRPNLELRIFCPDTILNRKKAISLELLLSKCSIKHHITVSNLTEIEKVQMYNRSDALIFPYSTDAVIIDPPIAVLEAMACGRTVITSRVLSIPDIIQNNKNGLLVDVDNFKGFAEAISYAMDNSQELRNIGKSARNTIQTTFEPKIVAEKMMNVYRSIMTN